MSQSRTFAYQMSFQEAVVGWFLHDQLFLERSALVVKPEFFADPVLRKIVSMVFDFVKKYKRRPDRHELAGIFNDGDSRIYLERILRCEAVRNNYGLDIVSDELEKFAKIESYREILLRSEKLYQQEKQIEALEMASREIDKTYKLSLKSDKTVEFDVDKILSRIEANDSECLTTGDPDFDEMIKEGSKVPESQLAARRETLRKKREEYDSAMFSGTITGDDGARAWANDLEVRTKGCFAKGDSTIVIGATNSGKTTFINTIVTANVLMNKKVLYIFHEDDEVSIMFKIIKTLLGITSAEVKQLRTNPEMLTKLKVIFNKCKENLVMLPVLDPESMAVESVIGQVKFLNEKMKSNTGAGFDLVVDDYPGLLWSQRIRNIKTEKRHEITECYFQFMQAAKALECHVLLPAQSNREGSRKQLQKDSKAALMSTEDVGEAYGIVQSADNVITINRTEDQVSKKTMTLFVAKTRSGEKFFKFHTRTDFARGRTHGFGLGSCIESATRPLTAAEKNFALGIEDTSPQTEDSKLMIGDVKNEKTT